MSFPIFTGIEHLYDTGTVFVFFKYAKLHTSSPMSSQCQHGQSYHTLNLVNKVADGDKYKWDEINLTKMDTIMS